MTQTIKLRSVLDSIWVYKRGNENILHRVFVISGPDELELGDWVTMVYDHRKQPSAPVLNYPGNQFFVILSEITQLKKKWKEDSIPTQSL